MDKFIFLLFYGIVIFFSLSNPVYGIYLFAVFFFIDPTQLFPEFNSYHLALICSIILLLSCLVRILAGKYKIIQLKFIGYTVLFMVIILFSLVLNGDKTTESMKIVPGMDMLGTLLKVTIFVFISTVFIRKRNELLTYLKFIILLCAINGIYAIYDQIKGALKSGLLYRTTGFFKDPNIFAAVLVCGFILAYYFFIHEKKKINKFLFLVSIFFMITGVFCTVSRTGLIVLVFAAGCIFTKNIKRITTVVIAALAVLLFFYIAKDLFNQRETVNKTLSGKTYYDSSTTKRLALMSAAFNMWISNPVFGVGLQNYYPIAKANLGYRSHRQQSPHNTYLQLLCETGLIGFISFMIIIVYSFRTAERVKSYGEFYSELAGYSQICLLSWCIVLLFLSVAVVIPLWFTIALPFNLDTIYKAENDGLEKQ